MTYTPADLIALPRSAQNARTVIAAIKQAQADRKAAEEKAA